MRNPTAHSVRGTQNPPARGNTAYNLMNYQDITHVRLQVPQEHSRATIWEDIKFLTYI